MCNVAHVKAHLLANTAHWLAHTAQAAIRAMVVWVFMTMFLTMFEFVDEGSAGDIAQMVFALKSIG